MAHKDLIVSGPIRASLYGGPDYAEKANETIITFAMIETKQAVSNLDAILSTPELDAIYVGPSDLSISLGYAPGGDKPDGKGAFYRRPCSRRSTARWSWRRRRSSGRS